MILLTDTDLSEALTSNNVLFLRPGAPIESTVWVAIQSHTTFGHKRALLSDQITFCLQAFDGLQ